MHLVFSLLLIVCAVLPQHAATRSLSAVSEFKRNDLKDVSEDGRLLLFYGTSRPMRTYTIPIGVSNYNEESGDDVLRVVDRVSGRELGRIRVAFFPEDVQLIPGTQRVFYTVPKDENGKLEWRLKIWDLASGEARECSSENAIAQSFSLFDAQHGLTTLQSAGGDRFSILSLPGCSQRLVGPIDPSNPNARVYGVISFSPGRKQFAYMAEEKLMVRDSATMDVVKEITPVSGLRWGRGAIYTPDGKFFILVAANTIFDKPETRRFLYFYDTTRYELVKRLDVTSWRPPELRDDVAVDSNAIGTAMAIGPDSRTMAVGYTKEKSNLFSTTEQAEVVIYDLETGEEIGRGSHPKIKQRRDDPFAAKIGKLVFTPGGRQLLSSTNDTLVWDIIGRE